MKIAKYLVLPMALLILGGCTPKNEGRPIGEDIPASTSLPYIKGTGISMLNQTVTAPSGETISLIPSNKNHLTVLSLWCPSCFNGSNAQLQELIKLHQEYAERGVRIIVIAYDTPSKELKEAIKNMGITFEMGTGNRTLYEALQIKSIPTTYYMDSAGTVIKTVEGFEAVEEMTVDIDELVQNYAADDADTQSSEVSASPAPSPISASQAGSSTAEGSAEQKEPVPAASGSPVG